MIHDVCLGSLPVIFTVDRSGIVGNDGETHQGILTYPFVDDAGDDGDFADGWCRVD